MRKRGHPNYVPLYGENGIEWIPLARERKPTPEEQKRIDAMKSVFFRPAQEARRRVEMKWPVCDVVSVTNEDRVWIVRVRLRDPAQGSSMDGAMSFPVQDSAVAAYWGSRIGKPFEVETK